MASKTQTESSLTQEHYFKELDIAARRIEALDRSMMTTRQLYFIVLGILVAGLTNVAKDQPILMVLIIAEIGVILLVIISLVLWLMDSHYHAYLRQAVKTCVALEKKIGFKPNSR